MNLTNTTNTISTEALAYAPLALQAVTGIEAAAAHLPGDTKAQIAVNIVLAAAQVAEGVPVPQVQAVAALVSLFVGILNATGLFSHKATPAPVNLGNLSGLAQGTGIAAAAQGYGQQTAPPFGTQPATSGFIAPVMP